MNLFRTKHFFLHCPCSFSIYLFIPLLVSAAPCLAKNAIAHRTWHNKLNFRILLPVTFRAFVTFGFALLWFCCVVFCFIVLSFGVDAGHRNHSVRTHTYTHSIWILKFNVHQTLIFCRMVLSFSSFLSLFILLVCARFVNSEHVFPRVRALTLLICQCFRCHYAITTSQLQAHTSFRLAFHESAADFMHSPRHAWHFLILSSVQFEIFLRWSGAKSKFSFWFSIPFVCLKMGRWQIKTLCPCESREKKFEFSLCTGQWHLLMTILFCTRDNARVAAALTIPFAILISVQF